MPIIEWYKAYQGRVQHGFTDEYRTVDDNPKIGSQKLRERKTLCGKWFTYVYDGWNMGWYNFGVPRCKKCEAKDDK